MALLAVPIVSYAADGKGLDTIPQAGQKVDGGEDAAKPAYSDRNIEEYLSTLEERGKIENPVVRHFAMARITGVLAVFFVGAIYVYRRYMKYLDTPRN